MADTRQATDRLRVLTWNLWWRFGPWQERAPSIRSVLEDTDADVIALQEVWSADGTSHAEILADELGLHHVGASRLDLDGVGFGNAVLARWPIVGHEVRPLPTGDRSDEGRTVLRADVDTPGGPLQVFCTHLNWKLGHSSVRVAQVSDICRFVADSPARSYPPILCGDLNATPDAEEIRMLTGLAPTPQRGVVFVDAWAAAGEGAGDTLSRDNPYNAEAAYTARRIDYVMVGWPPTERGGRVLGCQVRGTEATSAGPVPSDHYAVVADVAVTPALIADAEGSAP